MIRLGLEALNRLGIREIIFSGGEPLLRGDCLDLLRSAREMGFHLDLCTNAVLVTPEVAAWLGNSLSEISVSLDSANPILHDCLRGRPGAWKKTVEGIKHLIENGLEVHIITLVCDATIPRLEETIHFLSELHVQSVTLLGLVQTEDNRREFQFSEAFCARLIRSLPGLRERNPQIVINTKRVTARESASACGASKNIWGITATGELIPCILLQGRTQGIPLSSLAGFSTWQQVNEYLTKVNPESLWKLCKS
jgi:MoaA/NifB/PqqE/SkfB family radical SAM enzyme